MLKPGILTLDTNNHAVRGKSGVKTSEFSEKKLIYPPPSPREITPYIFASKIFTPYFSLSLVEKISIILKNLLYRSILIKIKKLEILSHTISVH